MRIKIVLLAVFFSIPVLAQNTGTNELGFSLGFSSIPQRSTSAGVPVNYGKSVAFEANYAHRFKTEGTQVFLEIPFVAQPSNSVKSADQSSIISLATIFVVPSVRVKFAASSAVSPWVSGGFGYGLAEGSEFFADGRKNPSRYQSTAVAQFGAGADIRTPIKIFFPISLRGEVRDFYSFTSPTYGTPISGGQNNIVVSGGFVVHF